MSGLARRIGDAGAALVAALLVVAVLAIAAPGAPGRWAYNVLYWLDAGINAVVLLGDPRETLSSRLGKWDAAAAGALGAIFEDGGGDSPAADALRAGLARLVCGALDLVDDGHCAESRNPDLGDKAVVP
jgi:hypothetical protein